MKSTSTYSSSRALLGFHFFMLIGWTALAQPTITSFSPPSGPIGATVTITGTGFNTTPGQNVVFFGATKATVAAAGSTSLSVTVPLGATHQYISVTNLVTNLTAYAAQPFVVTLDGSTTFGDKQDFTTGSQPRTASIGDLDGDGKTDLAVTNGNGSSISVFRNTSTAGTVSFAASAGFGTGSQPRSVVIGDIDGDGKPDLAVASSSTNNVSILRNTSTPGNINFAFRVEFATDESPYSVGIGDIDGDGKPDLAVANQGSNNVSVFRNTSTSGIVSFASKVDFAVGEVPFSVSIGDIDSDGKPDMVVVNNESTNVSVFRNTSAAGSISFSANVDFTTGSSPMYVSIGDIDGDDKPDLAVANFSGNNISVLRNTSSSGSVSFASKVDFSAGGFPHAVSIGDIDGDGKPDLAMANSSTGSASVLRNTSTSGIISFDFRVDFPTGGQARSVSIGDIDGDGKPDLAVSNLLSNTVSVLRQLPAPPLPPSITSFSPTSGAIGSSVTITGTRFNATPGQNSVFFGATKATVTAASATSMSVTVPAGATYQYISVTNLAVNLTAYSAQPFTVTLAGSMSFGANQNFTTGSQSRSVSIGDIDGDGKPDLAVANTGANAVTIFRNISTPATVSFAAKVDFATGSQPRHLSIGDIDGDGKPDLAVANTGSNTVSVFLNTSTSGTVSFAGHLDFAAGSTPNSVGIGDIDGDGKPDLAVANGNSSVSVLRSTSTSGTLSFETNVGIFASSQPRSIVIGDIDGDGKPDLAVANNFANTVSVLRNTSHSGVVNFASNVSFPAGTAPVALSIGDIDGDGKPDLAVVNFDDNNVSVLRNTSTPGTASFAGKVDFTAAGEPSSVSIGDIDGNGKPELAVANNSSNSVSVFRNTSTSGTVSFATRFSYMTGNGPFSASIGDIDGDGKPDLAVANGSSSASVLRQIPPLPLVYVTTPADGAINLPITLYVNARALKGATTYTIELNDEADFTGNSFVRSGTPRQSFTGLSYATTYYARVRTNLSPVYGNVTTFTTADASFFAYVINPAKNAVNRNANLSITSYKVPGATEYTIELSETADFGTVAFAVTGPTRTLAFSDLKYSTRYYSRVRTNLSALFGEVRSFTTRSAEGLAFVSSPADGAVDRSTTLNISANRVPNATQYTIQLSETNDFNVIAFEQTGSTRNLAFSGLKYNTTYFNRVITNAEETLDYGPVRSFTTRTAQSLAYVASPGNGATQVSGSPNIASNPVPGATLYIIQLSTTLDFTELAFEGTSDTRAIRFIGLAPGTTYFSRVRTNLTAESGEVRSFTTAGMAPDGRVAAEIMRVAPPEALSTESAQSTESVEELDLLVSVYPNPFYEKVSISVRSSRYDEASVILLDLTGRIVHESIEKTNVEVPISKTLPNGFYLLQVRAGNQTRVIRLVKSQY